MILRGSAAMSGKLTSWRMSLLQFNCVQNSLYDSLSFFRWWACVGRFVVVAKKSHFTLKLPGNSTTSALNLLTMSRCRLHKSAVAVISDWKVIARKFLDTIFLCSTQKLSDEFLLFSPPQIEFELRKSFGDDFHLLTGWNESLAVSWRLTVAAGRVDSGNSYRNSGQGSANGWNYLCVFSSLVYETPRMFEFELYAGQWDFWRSKS